MTSVSDYMFNNMGRIGADETDNTQRNLSNTKYANYVLENYFSESGSNSHVNFATQQPTVNFRGTAGGLPGDVIDSESILSIHTEQSRAFEKLQLNQRAFATIPYLGRGASNPVLESQLQQGETVGDKKSIGTIMEETFINYSDYPMLDDVKNRVTNPSFSVEESALSGWVRGGASSREYGNSSFSKK